MVAGNDRVTADEALRGLPPTVTKEDTTRWTRFPPRMLGRLIAPHDPRTLFGIGIDLSAVKSIERDLLDISSSSETSVHGLLTTGIVNMMNEDSKGKGLRIT